jgi:NADPH:quinone reductase-like Zn-dependent oxidoreductase
MKACVIDRYGKNEIASIREMPEPVMLDDDVLIQVHAASINPLDAKTRDGEFKLFMPNRFPLILGNDLAGVVVRVGSQVRRFKPGDEVYTRPHGDRFGGLAEYIAVKEDAVAFKPKNLSMEEAASVPLAALTAWQALVTRANVKKGQKVLIHAGSGGVGTFAIQLAKHLGASVATTTSTPNVELVKSLGADTVVDYKKQEFENVLHGYHVVLNSLGGDTLSKSVQVMSPGGRLISISGPPDTQFAKDLTLPVYFRPVMSLLSYGIRAKAKRQQVDYSFLFMTANGEQLGEITKLIEAGAIRPVVDQVFPFESVQEAIAYVDRGRAKGKVVVKIR